MFPRIIIFLVFTMLMAGILAAIQTKFGPDTEILMLSQLAPAFGSLVVYLVFKKVVIRYRLNISIFSRVLEILLVSTSLFFTGFLFCDFFRLLTPSAARVTWPAFAVIAGMIAGAAGEEIGWRSFLQASFEQKFPRYVSSIFVGLIWGLWHVGLYRNGVVFMIAFLIFTISVSLVLSSILYGTSYNLLLSTLFHFMINFNFFLFFRNNIAHPAMMIMVAAVWAIAALFYTFLLPARGILN